MLNRIQCALDILRCLFSKEIRQDIPYLARKGQLWGVFLLHSLNKVSDFVHIALNIMPYSTAIYREPLVTHMPYNTSWVWFSYWTQYFGLATIMHGKIRTWPSNYWHRMTYDLTPLFSVSFDPGSHCKMDTWIAIPKMVARLTYSYLCDINVWILSLNKY